MHPPARASRGRKRVRDGDDEPASTAAKAETLIASPRGLSLLLEVRALLGSMVERRAQIDMRLRTIDTRLDALADAPRGGPRADAAIAPLQSPPPSLIDDLPVELLALVAGALEPDDHLATSLACRKLRAAVALAQQQDGRDGSTTVNRSALTSLRKLTWAVSCRLPMRAELCDGFAREGRLVEISWLHAQGCPLRESTCMRAAEGGQMSVLQWLRVNGCPWNANTCGFAARGGHFQVLLWARANGCPWGTSTCLSAAQGGQLELLIWLRTNGCPWTNTTTMYAALGGHLALLQYARAAGCPWDYDTCLGAARNGHLAMLQWARANGCEWKEEEMCRAAVRGGHLALLQWVCANGCDLGLLTCAGARELMHMDPLELIEYLDSEDYENDEAMIEDPLGWMEDDDETEETAQQRHSMVEAIVGWLRASGCPED